MRVITQGQELKDFAADVGLPVVVKPIAGGGGNGVRVMHDQTALESCLEEWRSRHPPGPLLAETWIDGDFYQVNGLMVQGNITWSWPSRHLYPDLATLTSGAPGLSGMLSPHDPLFAPLQRATADVVAALPPVPEVRPLHAEYFHTPDGDLVLCEIACRAGGAAIVETHERGFGINLHEAGLKGQAGRPLAAPPSTPSVRHGFGWFPPLNGVLRHLPAQCLLPSAVRYLPVGVAGSRYELPRGLGPNVAQLVFTLSGPDVVNELRQVQHWWDSNVIWDCPNSPADDVGALDAQLPPSRHFDRTGGICG
jgi:hypothetical protein